MNILSVFASRSLLALALATVSMSTQAETAEEKGLAIFTESDVRNQGYIDSTGTLLMELIDKSGEINEREMRVKAMESKASEGDKTLMIFDSPKDQQGTALLTHQHEAKEDDQWLYLPALKRIKKIASKNQSGPFMGSEFSFEDIGGIQVNEYTYKFLREESLDGQTCFVVESYPTDENSGYSRIISWMDIQHYRTLKADFYDRKNSHLKTLKATGFQLYIDKFWRPDQLEMVNLQTGKSTRLIVKDQQFKIGLKDTDFTQNSLQRAR